MLTKNSVSKKFKNLTIIEKQFNKYDFWNSKFINSKFINCKFENCIFADATFENVEFENCEIKHSNFQHSSFIKSNVKISLSKDNLLDDLKVDDNSKLSGNFFKLFKKKIKKTLNNNFSQKEFKIYNALTKGKGYIVLKNYYQKNKISKVFKILDQIVKKDKKIKNNKNNFTRNKRINQKWIRSLVNINPIFSEFLLPKIVNKVFSKMIGENFICGSYSANCLLPGARGQNLHIDYPHYRFVSPGKNVPYKNKKNFFLDLQIITPFTEFTKINGSTAIVENSHKKNKYPDKEDIAKSKIKNIAMKPGSILIYNGLLWHGATPNFSKSQKRYAIVAQYVPNYIVPMENLLKMTNKKILKKSEEMKKLFGFNLEFPATYKS